MIFLLHVEWLEMPCLPINFYLLTHAWMAYSELPWRPFLGHQAWSWITLRRGNVFIFVTFFMFSWRLYFYLNVFLHLWDRRTDRQTDARQMQRPCCAYYATSCRCRVPSSVSGCDRQRVRHWLQDVPTRLDWLSPARLRNMQLACFHSSALSYCWSARLEPVSVGLLQSCWIASPN